MIYLVFISQLFLALIRETVRSKMSQRTGGKRYCTRCLSYLSMRIHVRLIRDDFLVGHFNDSTTFFDQLCLCMTSNLLTV